MKWVGLIILKGIKLQQEDQNRPCRRKSGFQQANRNHSDKSQPSIRPGVTIFPSKVLFVKGLSIQLDWLLVHSSSFSSIFLLTPPKVQSLGWAVAAQVKRNRTFIHRCGGNWACTCMCVCTHTIPSLPPSVQKVKCRR